MPQGSLETHSTLVEANSDLYSEGTSKFKCRSLYPVVLRPTLIPETSNDLGTNYRRFTLIVGISCIAVDIGN